MSKVVKSIISKIVENVTSAEKKSKKQYTIGKPLIIKGFDVILFNAEFT